jgi:hypothetical protein
MDKDEALKLALEALELLMSRTESMQDALNASKQARTAITAIKQALAAPVLEGRDWSLLEATQESLREHMAEIKRLKGAQPAVPDALTSADIDEHIEYVAGWNDCRAEMLKGMKP